MRCDVDDKLPLAWNWLIIKSARSHISDMSCEWLANRMDTPTNTADHHRPYAESSNREKKQSQQIRSLAIVPTCKKKQSPTFPAICRTEAVFVDRVECGAKFSTSRFFVCMCVCVCGTHRIIIGWWRRKKTPSCRKRSANIPTNLRGSERRTTDDERKKTVVYTEMGTHSKSKTHKQSRTLRTHAQCKLDAVCSLHRN